MLINLTVLNISNNRLTDIHGVGALLSLCELILDHNDLLEVPEELAVCKKLHTLSIQHNQFASQSISGVQSIPSIVFVATELKSLQSAGNPVTQREILAFEGIESVLERRRMNKDKLLQGGALSDGSLFGLEKW